MLSPSMFIHESASGFPPGQKVMYSLMKAIPGSEFSANSKSACETSQVRGSAPQK